MSSACFGPSLGELRFRRLELCRALLETLLERLELRLKRHLDPELLRLGKAAAAAAAIPGRELDFLKLGDEPRRLLFGRRSLGGRRLCCRLGGVQLGSRCRELLAQHASLRLGRLHCLRCQLRLELHRLQLRLERAACLLASRGLLLRHRRLCSGLLVRGSELGGSAHEFSGPRARQLGSGSARRGVSVASGVSRRGISGVSGGRSSSAPSVQLGICRFPRRDRIFRRGGQRFLLGGRRCVVGRDLTRTSARAQREAAL